MRVLFQMPKSDLQYQTIWQHYLKSKGEEKYMSTRTEAAVKTIGMKDTA